MTKLDTKTPPQFSVAEKKNTQTTYYLPCLIPYLVQLVDELDTTLYASAYFMFDDIEQSP